jgi:3-(3-hydroxy-phenyl)propionate hydroxylase
MIAKQWRQGRLFIAGDAAHQTPPFMGQGMCAGIRDAANLGWKLQAILRRGASETLLKSYQTERQPHVQEYIDLTIQMGHMINRTATAIIAGNATDPEDGPQTMRQLKPLLGPGIGIGRSPLIGSLFPQPKLSSGILLDDAIGNSFALITSVLFHLKLTKNDQEKIEKLGIVIISNDADQLEDWFKKNTIEAVLLRPDRYILGTATRLSELSELLLFFDEMPIV